MGSKNVATVFHQSALIFHYGSTFGAFSLPWCVVGVGEVGATALASVSSSLADSMASAWASSAIRCRSCSALMHSESLSN